MRRQLAKDVGVNVLLIGSGKGLFDTKTKAYTQATEGTKNRLKAAASGKPLQVGLDPLSA